MKTTAFAIFMVILICVLIPVGIVFFWLWILPTEPRETTAAVWIIAVSIILYFAGLHTIGNWRRWRR